MVAVVFHYRIVERIGSGGMGVVYRAEDTTLHRFVALKFLSADGFADRQAVARFRRETIAASALNHPNICTIGEIGEHGDRPFMAMELLDDTSLGRRIQAGPLPLVDVIAIGSHSADALDDLLGRGDAGVQGHDGPRAVHLGTGCVSIGAGRLPGARGELA